jgi:hypothetical protein
MNSKNTEIAFFLSHIQRKPLSPDQPIEFWAVRSGEWFEQLVGKRQLMAVSTLREISRHYPNVPQWGPVESSLSKPIYYITEVRKGGSIKEFHMQSHSQFFYHFDDYIDIDLNPQITKSVSASILAFPYKKLSPDQPVELWEAETNMRFDYFSGPRRLVDAGTIREFSPHFSYFPQWGPVGCSLSNPLILIRELADTPGKMMTKDAFEEKYSKCTIIT